VTAVARRGIIAIMPADRVIQYDPALDRDPHREDVDDNLLEDWLSLSIEERIERHERMLENVRLLRQSAIEHYGFDPRIPETDE
jgi:hypothetical protein